MDEFEEFAKDPKRLSEHLNDHINEMYQTLNDDEEFCDRDIAETKKYITKMKENMLTKFRELEKKLEELQEENHQTSEINKKKFDDQTQEINTLLADEKYREAWKIFKDYETNFEQRSTVIERIPKLHMNETDIERYFSSKPRSIDPPPPSPPTQSVTTFPSSIRIDEKRDDIDDTSMTLKQEQRRQKVIESVQINRDNEELNTEKTEEPIDNSGFGARSNRIENQPKSISTATLPVVKYSLSNRLPPDPNRSTRLPFSTQNNLRQASLTPSNYFPPIRQPTITQLPLNPICHYQHDRNKILLMACNYQYIVLFKSQRNRLDRWELGAIERGSQCVIKLDWHDGLIISMGCLGNDKIYMFTEREFFIYSIHQRRKLDSRILPRGNDDEFEYNHLSTEYQRGIGTVNGQYWYHMYSNRSSHWTLSTNILDQLAHHSDLDLTRMFPDVSRFIHLSVNEKIFHFLVQLYDLNYAVVSYPKHSSFPTIILPGAQQPLSIYSVYHQSSNEYLCFINDPSIETLHITTTRRFIQSYSISAYAISSLAEKSELLLVKNDSIQSININQINFVF